MIILNNTDKTFRFHEYTESGVATVAVLPRDMRRLNDREAGIVSSNIDAQYRIATGEIALSGYITKEPVVVDDMATPPPAPWQYQPPEPIEVTTVIDDIVVEEPPVEDDEAIDDIVVEEPPVNDDGATDDSEAIDDWEAPVADLQITPKKRGRRKKGQ